MDGKMTSTQKLPHEQYITVIVLVTGVLGGLGLIIIIILCFKHCSKKPPQTGLDVEDQNGGQKMPISPNIIEAPKETSDIELTTLNKECLTTVRESSLSSEPADSRTIDNWKDRTDFCGRFYSEQHTKANTNSRLLKRDSSQIVGKPGQTPKTILNRELSYGSRRNLQSSVESSGCTDNRSEVTVIDTTVCDARLEPSIFAESQDDQWRTASPMLSSGDQKYLSVFRPVARRRLSTQSELASSPKSRQVRQIKSHDDSMLYHRCQSQNDDIMAEHSSFDGDICNHQGSAGISKEQTVQVEPNSVWVDIGCEDDVATVQVHQQPGRPLSQQDNLSTRSHSFHRSSRDLWQLRSNLEQEITNEDAGDEGAEMRSFSDDNNSRCPSDYDGDIVCSVVCASFESTEHPATRQANENRLPAENLLHPPEEMFSKRNNYQQRRFRTGSGHHIEGNSSTEKSFDSVDTTTTDGAHSSESSRVEMTTTSFESSTTDSDTHSRRQRRFSIKGDSGYKSTDIHQSAASSMKTISFAVDEEPSDADQLGVAVPRALPHRTASRRRRDFQSRNSELRQKTNDSFTSCSSYEQEMFKPTTEDSFDESRVPVSGSNFNIFNRLFRSGKYNRRRQSERDWSIDEKSDSLFKEFSRYDPNLDLRTMTQRIRSQETKTLNHQPIPEDLTSGDIATAECASVSTC